MAVLVSRAVSHASRVLNSPSIVSGCSASWSGDSEFIFHLTFFWKEVVG
jgi:hypothetical protein